MQVVHKQSELQLVEYLVAIRVLACTVCWWSEGQAEHPTGSKQTLSICLTTHVFAPMLSCRKSFSISFISRPPYLPFGSCVIIAWLRHHVSVARTYAHLPRSRNAMPAERMQCR